MDGDLKRRELLQRRRLISQNMLEDIKSWDKSVEQAEKILGDNEKWIKELQNVSVALMKFDENEIYDSAYEDNIKNIMLLNRELINVIAREQHRILRNIKETDKVKSIAENYISKKREPMFIDKDI